MSRNILFWAVVFGCCRSAFVAAADGVLFEDDFDDGLSDKWQLVGLKEEDYRVRDGALELRVQPGKPTKETPMLKVILPLDVSGTAVASVEVSIVDEFTQFGEFAGVFLIDENGTNFGAKKQFIDGKLVFSPGKVIFAGTQAETADASKYTMKYSPSEKEAGPLRIVVNQGYAHFQVGPSASGRYRNFFHSAIGDEYRGFGLTAAGAPDDAVHWVRFDNFRVTK